MTRTWATLLVAAVLILLSPLLLPLFIVVALLAILVACYHWLRFLVFCLSHLDDVYLVCSRRRGWEPFLANNLIPVLPPYVKAIWIESTSTHKDLLRALRPRRCVTAIPFLALVTPTGIQCKSLNRLLVEYKQHGKPSNAMQDALRPFVEKTLQELSQQYVQHRHTRRWRNAS